MTSTAAPARPIAAVEGRQRGPRSPIAWLLAAAAPVLGLLFVAGWRYGAVGPLFAVAMLVLATLDSAWGQVFHTENLVVLHLLILAAGPAAGGLDWLDGDTLRHLVANDNLRKALLGDSYSPIGTHMVGQAWLFPPLAVVTVAVELGAVLALRGGRWRTAWVAAAWLFHVGVLALMAIVFPYQLAGVAFAPFFRLERLADRYTGRATGRTRARRPCWGPVSRACGAG